MKISSPRISEQLKAAKSLISDSANWIQEDYAQDGKGNSVKCIQEGVCFCSLGAIKKIRMEGWGDTDRTPESSYLSRAVILIDAGNSVLRFNDTHTHAEVMAMWDKAIEMAEKDEQNV